MIPGDFITMAIARQRVQDLVRSGTAEAPTPSRQDPLRARSPRRIRSVLARVLRRAADRLGDSTEVTPAGAAR